MFGLMKEAERCLKEAIHPEGFNVGLNVGKAAGAGIKDHLHLHVIPRWTADTNFWPVVAETKGMPEHLMTTYARLNKFWKKSWRAAATY